MKRFLGIVIVAATFLAFLSPLRAGGGVAGSQEFVGMIDGEPAFRLCITFSHPPEPYGAVISRLDGREVCSTTFFYNPSTVSILSCTLPNSALLVMTLVRDHGLLFSATVGGRSVNGELRSI